MTTYKIDFEPDNGILRIGFADNLADNNRIVVDADKRLEEIIKAGQVGGGALIKINGPASLPVAMVLAHRLSHLYQAVACFDPKLGKYVVAITHSDKYVLGDLLD